MDARRTGAFIAELRNEKGWKQKDLAATLQVSDKAISRWETGKGFPDTILCLLLDVLVITRHPKKHGVIMQKIKNAALFCSVFTILFSVLPLFLYGTLYVNGASYAITMLLSASTMLQVFNAPHGND